MGTASCRSIISHRITAFQLTPRKIQVSLMARRNRRPWYIDPIPSYYGYDGDWHYFGRPGFYGGRYNGGSFRPLLDADADRADLELWLIELSLKDRARVHPFAGTAKSAKCHGETHASQQSADAVESPTLVSTGGIGPIPKPRR
jgi:hypothetical protein